jgi:hypothetical protein
MQHEVQQVLKAPDQGSKARKRMQALSKQQARCTTVLLTISVWHDCINAPMYSQDNSKQSHGIPAAPLHLLQSHATASGVLTADKVSKNANVFESR